MKKGSRLSSGTTSSYRSSKTPSLLNGNGDGKSIYSTDARDPEASPTQSRSSSAQGSCSTSATTFEEADDAAGATKSGSKSKEPKGNVLVSVRVRPDAGAGDGSKAGTEWMVDGRKCLISYGGKEGGDYYYGMERLCGYHVNKTLTVVMQQIMSLRCRNTTPKSMIPPRSALSGGSWRDTMALFSLTA